MINDNFKLNGARSEPSVELFWIFFEPNVLKNFKVLSEKLMQILDLFRNFENSQT